VDFSAQYFFRKVSDCLSEKLIWDLTKHLVTHSKHIHSENVTKIYRKFDKLQYKLVITWHFRIYVFLILVCAYLKQRNRRSGGLCAWRWNTEACSESKQERIAMMKWYGGHVARRNARQRCGSFQVSSSQPVLRWIAFAVIKHTYTQANTPTITNWLHSWMSIKEHMLAFRM